MDKKSSNHCNQHFHIYIFVICIICVNQTLCGISMFVILWCSAYHPPAAQLHEEFFQRREAARLYKAKMRGELYDDRVSVAVFLSFLCWDYVVRMM